MANAPLNLAGTRRRAPWCNRCTRSWAKVFRLSGGFQHREVPLVVNQTRQCRKQRQIHGRLRQRDGEEGDGVGSPAGIAAPTDACRGQPDGQRKPTHNAAAPVGHHHASPDERRTIHLPRTHDLAEGCNILNPPGRREAHAQLVYGTLLPGAELHQSRERRLARRASDRRASRYPRRLIPYPCFGSRASLNRILETRERERAKLDLIGTRSGVQGF